MDGLRKLSSQKASTNKALYIQWDSENWFKALDCWEASAGPFDGLSCMEIGCAQGGLALWFAQKKAHVLATDINDPAESVLQFHRRHIYPGKIEYRSVDARHIPYENQFDIIYSKSVLGMTDNNSTDIKERAIAQVYKALKPGGKYLFAENLESSVFHRLLRKWFVRWFKDWYYFKYDEIAGCFDKFSKVMFVTVGFLGLFGRSEKQRILLGKLDTLVFDKMIPPRYRYIVIGIAEK